MPYKPQSQLSHRHGIRHVAAPLRRQDCTRLLIAFAPLLILTLAARWLSFTLGPEVAAVVALLMGLGALPALMLHWVRPAQAGPHTLLMAGALALPGMALSLQLWHDWLVAHGVAPLAPLAGVALALALVQAIALRADRAASRS